MSVRFPHTPGSGPTTTTSLGLGSHRNGIYGTLATRPLIQTPQKHPTNNSRIRSALNLKLITPSKHQEAQVECLGDAATYLSPLSQSKVITSFARGDISGRPRTRLEAEARRKRNIWSMERSGDWGCADYLEWHKGEVCPCQHNEDYMENDEDIEIYMVPGDDGSSSELLEVSSDSEVMEREARVENWVEEESRWSLSLYTHDSQSSRCQKFNVLLCAFCGKISKASCRSAADLESDSYWNDISMQDGPYRDGSVSRSALSGSEEYLCFECGSELEARPAGQWWPSKKVVWWAVGAVVVVAWAGSVWRYLLRFNS